jgi:hypothetical protein
MASEWIKHVQATYRANKATNKFYQYKQAMVDAKKTFKSGSVAKPVKRTARKKRRVNKTRRA